MGSDEAEVDVHQKYDQTREEENVGCKEALQRGRAHDNAALHHVTDGSAKLRGRR
jgi:hypothetical protein